MRFLLLVTISCGAVLAQSGELYVPGLSVLKLGTAKADVMRAIPDRFLIEELGKGKQSIAEPKSEANDLHPDSAWAVLRRSNDEEIVAILYFDKLMLGAVERHSFIHSDAEAVFMFKSLFSLLIEETNSGDGCASLATDTKDDGSMVSRKIEIRIGGKRIIIAMPEGKDAEGRRVGGITIMKRIAWE